MKRSDERKHNRWAGYNYSTPGWFFVTVCVKGYKCLLGRVVNSEMVLNESGKIVKKCWHDLPNHYANCCLEDNVIMPNHVHGIIVIKNNINVGTGLKPVPTDGKYSLSEIVRGFKTFSSRRINELGINFRWQRSFYDHVIGFDGYELQNVQEYIKNNPAKWDSDRNNKGI